MKKTSWTQYAEDTAIKISEESKKYFSEEQAGEVFTAARLWSIELESDMMKYGTGGIRELISKARNMLTECEQLYASVSERNHGLRGIYLRQCKALDLIVQRMYAADDEVRREKHARDREALALYKVPELNIVVKGLELACDEAGGVLSFLKTKRSDLKHLIDVLMDTLRSCQKEIGSGI